MEKYMREECEELSKILLTFDPHNAWKLGEEMTNAPLLVLAFDEAHTLTSAAGQSVVYQPSHIFGRVISSWSQCTVQRAPIWAVFASTTSRISHYAAPNATRAFLTFLSCYCL
jgi:hypothetical protein